MLKKRLNIINEINSNIVKTYESLLQAAEHFKNVMASLVLLRTFQEEVIEIRYGKVIEELQKIKDYCKMAGANKSKPTFLIEIDKQLSGLIADLKSKNIWEE